MVTKLIEYAYRTIGYQLSSLFYSSRFIKKSVREDVLLNALRIYGTSMTEINDAIDNMPNTIPGAIRLPGCLKDRDGLIDHINSAINEIIFDPERKKMDRNKKSRMIARNIAYYLHTELAYDPKVFEHIMNKEPEVKIPYEHLVAIR